MTKLFTLALLFFTTSTFAQTRPVTVATPNLIAPANGAIVGQQQKFIWQAILPTLEKATYKIKIVELIGDQSPEEALRTNKPHFEKDSLNELSFQYPSSSPSFIKGKKYGWIIQYFNRERKSTGYSNSGMFLGNVILTERKR